MEMGGLTQEVRIAIVEQAEERAEEAEQAAAAERRRSEEQERIDKATAEAGSSGEQPTKIVASQRRSPRQKEWISAERAIRLGGLGKRR